MKNILFLIAVIPSILLGQNCLTVDSVYSTAKFKDLGKRDIRFGIKQMTEDMLSEKYCISNSGKDVDVEVFFFGLPKTTVRII
jgi:hypothetical protein